MCGILGFSILNDCKYPINYLSRGVESLKHRGPDSNGYYEDLESKVGLGHTRLSILDTSSLGHQPMKSSDGNFVVVYNGEIYNHKELREWLEVRGINFLSKTDTEVLLNLYIYCIENKINFDEKLLELNGIFAFAIFDKINDLLIIVRDSLGVKPLYYQINNQGFFFASEIKALPRGEVELDEAAINDYITYLWSPGNSTMNKEIKKLGPSELMRIKNGQIVQYKNWNLSEFTNGKWDSGKTQRSIKTVINELDFELRKSVHSQLVADVPVGAFLSGGIDSSGIVAYASEVKHDIRCFTINSTFKAGRFYNNEDLSFAKLVANHLKVKLEVVSIDGEAIARQLPFMIAQLDEPLADPACLNVFFISKFARESGIKVLLSGTGGDDIFTGYRRHQAVNSEFLWTWLSSNSLNKLESLSTKLSQNSQLTRRLRKIFSAASMSENDRIVNYFRWIGRRDLDNLYSNEFLNKLNLSGRNKVMLEFLESMPLGVEKIEKMLALEQRFFLADHNLLYTDKMAMATGVEVRVPYLDSNVIKFAQQIPTKLKIKNFNTKWILRKTLKSYLPQEIINRPKVGFGNPLNQWLRVELKDMLHDLLSEKSITSRGIFNSNSVKKLIRLNYDDEIDASHTIFSLMCIEIWMRQNV